MTIKSQIVEQYRKLRNMERACIVEEINEKQKKIEDEATTPTKEKIDELNTDIIKLNDEKTKHWSSVSNAISKLTEKRNKITKEIDAELDKLRNSQSITDSNIYKQISVLNTQLYKLQNEQRKSLDRVRTKYSSCHKNQPKKLADFDEETEGDILKFLNGDLKKLVP